MKKLFSLGSLCCLFMAASASVVYWDGGGGDSKWSTAANWSANLVPVAGDEVILNTSVIILADFASPGTIGSLSVTGGSQVTLQTTATTNLRLTLTAGSALFIEAGSSLTMDAITSGTDNSSIILYGTGPVASIYGQLIFSGTGNPDGGTFLRTYTSSSNYGLATVYDGGMISYQPGSSNTVSTTAFTTIHMKNGSVYEITKNGGSFPAGQWDDHSLARTSGSGDRLPSFNGSEYGNFVADRPGLSTALGNFLNQDISFHDLSLLNTNSSHIYGAVRIKTGASAGTYILRIRGDLYVGPLAKIVLSTNTVSAGNGAFLITEGHVINEGKIETQGVSGTMNNWVWGGNTLQEISGSGTLAGPVKVTMNNTAGVKLISPFTISHQLELTVGKINTAASRLLTLTDNATATGGSTLSFVEGPMRKAGNDDFVFPVGKGEIYAPIAFTNISGAATADIVTAEYQRLNPRSHIGSPVEPGQDHISYVEYWDMHRTGSAIRSVSLAVHPLSFSRDIAHTYVGQWDGIRWNSLGATISNFAVNGIYETGRITATTATASAGPFTLITDKTAMENPLPLQLLTFKVKRINASQAIMDLHLTGDCEQVQQVRLQTASGTGAFETIRDLPCHLLAHPIQLADSIRDGFSQQYRLEIIGRDGQPSYSPVITLAATDSPWKLVMMTPQPTGSSATVHINSDRRMILHAMLLRADGTPLYRWQCPVAAGENRLPVDLSKLASGLYFLRCTDGVTLQTLKIIRQ